MTTKCISRTKDRKFVAKYSAKRMQNELKPIEFAKFAMNQIKKNQIGFHSGNEPNWTMLNCSPALCHHKYVRVFMNIQIDRKIFPHPDCVFFLFSVKRILFQSYTSSIDPKKHTWNACFFFFGAHQMLKMYFLLLCRTYQK